MLVIAKTNPHISDMHPIQIMSTDYTILNDITKKVESDTVTTYNIGTEVAIRETTKNGILKIEWLDDKGNPALTKDVKL